MNLNDLPDELRETVKLVLEFVRTQGRTTAGALSEEFGAEANLLAGAMVSWKMLEVVGVGADGTYEITVFD